MVYVDDMYKYKIGEFRRMKMSHLMADSTEELLEFVRRLRVNEKWIQHAGDRYEHFDICLSKRSLAIKEGAIEVYYGVSLGSAYLKRKGPNDAFIFEDSAFIKQSTLNFDI